MDRAVEARRAAAMSRQRYLKEEVGRLTLELLAARKKLSEANEEIRNCEKAAQPRHKVIAEEAWRRKVRELGTFTVSELAAELDCSKPTASKRLKALIDAGMVTPAGRVLGQKCFEYAKPTEAGAAFEQQQRMETHTAPEVMAQRTAGDAPERGVVVATGTMDAARKSLPKEIWPLIQQAVADGWNLMKGGGKHSFYLTRYGKRIPLSGSPTDPTYSSRYLRQALQRAERAAA